MVFKIVLKAVFLELSPRNISLMEIFFFSFAEHSVSTESQETLQRENGFVKFTQCSVS